MKWQLCRLEWSKWVRVRRVLVFSFLAALLVASPIQALNASREDEWSTYDIFWFDPDEDLSLVPADRSNCGLSGDIMVSGTDATGKIWSALISGGLTPEQAAGVMGNIQVESGFGPTRHENSFINSDYNIEEKYTYVNSNGKTVEVSYGIGLVQWSAGRRRNLLANMPADQKALLLDRETYGRLNGDQLLAQLEEEGRANLFNDMIAYQVNFLIQELNAGRYFEPGNDWNYQGPFVTQADFARAFMLNFERPKDQSEAAQAGRVGFAESYYQLYRDASPTDMAVPGAEITKNTVFVGDQRMADICTTIGLENCVTNQWADYAWLANQDTRSAIRARIQNNPQATVVIGLGLNDLGNAASYAAELNRQAAGNWAGHRVVMLSVAPIDESLAAAGGNSTTNAEIEAFNTAMQGAVSAAGVSFCSSLAQNVVYTGTDGIRYDESGNESVYSAIVNGCGGGSAGGGMCQYGVLVTGGMNMEQAQEIADFYNTADRDLLDQFLPEGLSNPCDASDKRWNCVSFSRWFVNYYTDLGAGNGSIMTSVGNGVDAAGYVANHTRWQLSSARDGALPRAYSVFSYEGGSKWCSSSGAYCGHTGVIVGVDGNSVVTIEASCGSSGGKVHVYDMENWMNAHPSLEFTYIPDDAINLEGGANG